METGGQQGDDVDDGYGPWMKVAQKLRAAVNRQPTKKPSASGPAQTPVFAFGFRFSGLSMEEGESSGKATGKSSSSTPHSVKQGPTMQSKASLKTKFVKKPTKRNLGPSKPSLASKMEPNLPFQPKILSHTINPNVLTPIFAKDSDHSSKVTTTSKTSQLTSQFGCCKAIEALLMRI